MRNGRVHGSGWISRKVYLKTLHGQIQPKMGACTFERAKSRRSQPSRELFKPLANINIAGVSGETQTNLNFEGTTDNLVDFLNTPGSGFTSMEQDAMVGLPHAGYDGNYRQNGTTWSMQINTNGLGAQIDIDPFNPADGLFGGIAHLVDVGRNNWRHRDTDPFKTAKALGKRGVNVGEPCMK